MLSAGKQGSRRGADDVCACSRRQRTGSPEKRVCDRREGRDDPEGEICEALPDSIQKDGRERRHGECQAGHTEAVGHRVVACRKGPNEWKRLDSIGMRDAEDGRQREHFA